MDKSREVANTCERVYARGWLICKQATRNFPKTCSWEFHPYYCVESLEDEETWRQKTAGLYPGRLIHSQVKKPISYRARRILLPQPFLFTNSSNHQPRHALLIRVAIFGEGTKS
jgi:hypothetical protein